VVKGLTTAAVRTGLIDGAWDTTDEVRPDAGGPWETLENHAEFAELAAEVNPPVSGEHEDESILDMNPLIDVSLVLLIFFILTTTYETIRKVLDMPAATQSKMAAGARSAAEKIKEMTIRIEARSSSGNVTIKVENETVAIDNLVGKLNQFSQSTGKKQVLLDAQGVEWGTVVQIMDAARAAGIEKTLLAMKGETAAPTTPVERP
jgi:biopolymer transport protein ExbD